MSSHEIDTGKVSLLKVTADNAGQRVDNFLISILKGVPKTLVYRIIRKGEVRVNKGRVKADTRLNNGDIVRVPPLRLAEQGEAPVISSSLQQGLESAIVYEDSGLLAINKPHGLAVHGGSGVTLGLIEALRAIRPDHSFLELVHRLDRDTSGIILVAKKRSVLVALQKMLANKAGISKKYLALVHGQWDASITEVDAPLLRYERQSGERMVMVDSEGKTSLTRMKLLALGSHYSLIEAEPVTGRTHQIRVHCQYQNHPIAGDEKYRNRTDEDIDKRHNMKRLCLHAHRLTFRHPESGIVLDLKAEIDEDLRAIFAKAGCQYAF